MGFGLEDRVSEAELFALVSVGDRNALVLVAVALDDLFLLVADDDDDVVDADLEEVIEDVLDEGFVVYLDEDLRFVVGERPEAGAFSGC